MPRIKVLPPDLRNKIAAGEVIERPASIVKELIENSIDAGSSDIKIEVSYGGKRLIRVSDDGCGMDMEDALRCFERHATSKLLNEEGLFDIRTLGFRGEALPSIASISRMQLVTGVAGSEFGTSLEIEGGEIRNVRDSVGRGTVLSVNDIFFNTPARKKFLKTSSTELFHIMDIVTKEALAHYETAFTLLIDNKEKMLFPRASGYRERVMQVYGQEFLDGLIEFSSGRGDMKLHAFISKTENFRNSKAHQFIFVNRRSVKDQTIGAALYRAYEGVRPGDRHPVYFLFFALNPSEVDFNVHPAKREVRFELKEKVYRFIYGRTRDAVKEDRTNHSPSFAEQSGTCTERTLTEPYAYAPSPPFSEASFAAENIVFDYRPTVPFIYLGETFVAVSDRGGLTVIDHHAAHERILYEKFLKNIRLDSHQLLFPRPVKLSHKEYTVILENKPLLGDFGIEVDDFGHDTVVIRALPLVLEDSDMRGILFDAASAILEGDSPGRSLKEALAARIACHSSVRGKEVLNQEELARLLADLEETECPDQCPHGRPTRIFYSLDDLKKLFKRK
jgi:DNA mismatch repair protein MutL